ncbi:MAG: EMC3/TMCO1 family protein [Nanoarchaeota archaeon]|nr:EMC3/TMCO1 family protein [Nanoarchaeota archaeon]
MKALKGVLIVLLISSAIALLWDHIPIIKQSAHAVLDPSAGKILDYNVNIGMILVAGIISLFITVIQKYTVDNETLKQLKQDQKKLQQDMKDFKNHPEKYAQLQTDSLKKAGEMMSISMKSFSYTAIPIILFFRWFSDYFAAFDPPIRIFGFLNWLLAYIIFSIIFSMIFRKVFKLP